jgi:hypothetical protein
MMIEPLSDQEARDAVDTFEKEHIISKDLYFENKSLRQLIYDLKEDGERLAQKYGSWNEWGDAVECVHCEQHNAHSTDENGIAHTPDCPITLHAALMERVKGMGIE